MLSTIRYLSIHLQYIIHGKYYVGCPPTGLSQSGYVDALLIFYIILMHVVFLLFFSFFFFLPLSPVTLLLSYVSTVLIIMPGSYLGLKGSALQVAIGLIAGMDFLLFGYDQGVTGGLLSLDSFVAIFPEIATSGPEYDGLSPAEKSARSTDQGILQWKLSRKRVQLTRQELPLLHTISAASWGPFPPSGLETGWAGARPSSSARLSWSSAPFSSVRLTICRSSLSVVSSPA